MPKDIFGLSEGERLRDIGKDLAAKKREAHLIAARDIAYEVGMKQDVVTIDDVYRGMLEAGLDITTLRNAAGSVFRGAAWTPAGSIILNGKFVGTISYQQSTRIGNHSRRVQRWSLVKRLLFT